MSEFRSKVPKEYKILVTETEDSSSIILTPKTKSRIQGRHVITEINKSQSYGAIQKQLEILKYQINHIENKVSSQSMAIERINQGNISELKNRILSKIKALNN